MGEGAADGFDRQAEIVGDVLALHGEFDRSGAPPVAAALSIDRNQARRSSAELRPTIVIWSTAWASARVTLSNMAALNCGSRFIRARQIWRDSAAIVAGVDRLDRQSVRVVGLEAAHVARHVEGEDLPPAVAGHLHRAEHAAHDEEVILGRIAFADHFLSGRVGDDDGFGVRKPRRRRIGQIEDFAGGLRGPAPGDELRCS